MEHATSVLDLVPANKVPPAPVLPRLPLHLLKKNQEVSKGSKAKKVAGPVERSESLEGVTGGVKKGVKEGVREKVEKEVEKGDNEGKTKQSQRRSSETLPKRNVVVNALNNRRKSETAKGVKHSETGLRSVVGSGAQMSNTRVSGIGDDKDSVQTSMASKEAEPRMQKPAAQPSSFSISTIDSIDEQFEQEDRSMQREEPCESVLQSETSTVASRAPESTDTESGASGSLRNDSDDTDQPMPDMEHSENEQFVLSLVSEHESASSHKQDTKHHKPHKNKAPAKTLPVSRFANSSSQVSKTASLPEAQISIARTLDWDFENQSELLLGQASASFQSADFLDGALSRFAGLKLEPRNPLHRLRKVGSAILARQRGLQESRFGRPTSSARSEAGEVLLDGFLLCDAAGVELPEEAEAVNLCGSHLTAVEMDDMRFFERLTAVNAADNYLKMENFTGLASLTRLLLPCNKLEKLRFLPGHFQTLEVLDVSFNHLTRTDLSLLSTLPRLLELYFDHNRLSGHLPPDAFLPGRFHRLQKLSLSANGLPSSSLTSLSKLPCLRSLSLGRNPIQRIPPESVGRDARGSRFPCLTELDLAGTRITEPESALGLVHLAKTLRRIALWETPLSVRAGSDGNGDPLESALPILAAAAEAADRGQRWLLTKPKPRSKPALFGAQIGATVEELSKEHLADLAAAYPETQLIAALERVQKRFEAPLEATDASEETLSGSPQGSSESSPEDRAAGVAAGSLEVPGDEEPGTTERELYQLANAPTPAGGLPHIDDTSAAVLALKYALKHPLVKTNPLPEHHQQLNTLAKIRLEDSVRRKVPLSPTRELTRSKIEETIQEAKKEEVAANIEDILAKMKARLNQVEKKLKKAGHGKV